jgi:hypothetical protein
MFTQPYNYFTHNLLNIQNFLVFLTLRMYTLELSSTVLSILLNHFALHIHMILYESVVLTNGILIYHLV